MKQLRVLARGDIAVLDVGHAMAHGQYRLTARRLIRAESRDKFEEAYPLHSNVVFRDRDPQVASDKFYVECWVPIPTPVPVSNIGSDGYYFRKQVYQGALWPADEETALECGIAFDPTFGGDFQKEGA